MNPAPDPMTLHPVAGQRRVVFLKPLVSNPNIIVGEYSYYDDPDDPTAFERDAVLYAYGPEQLIIGRYCAIASGVRFLMPGANHADLGPSTFPFGILGPPWSDTTMDLVMSAPSRGDTTIGNDVWLGYQALVLPGVTIGHGAVVAAASVVAANVDPYTVVAGNPARVVRRRFDEEDVARLLRAAWWDWPVGLVTQHARVIMAGEPAQLELIATREGLLPGSERARSHAFDANVAAAALKRPYLSQMPFRSGTYSEAVGGSSPPAGLGKVLENDACQRASCSWS